MSDHRQPQREPKKRETPRRADQQDAPEQERPATPLEDAGQAIQDLRDPPQAEGGR